MNAKEKKTLNEVLTVLHTAEARIRSLPEGALEDDVFTTATLIFDSLKSVIQTHRAANIEAHTCVAS